MAAGQRRAVIVDTHVDWKRLQVTHTVDTYIEDSDGVETTLNTRTFEVEYPDSATLKAKALDAVVQDGVQRAATVKVPVTLVSPVEAKVDEVENPA